MTGRISELEKDDKHLNNFDNLRTDEIFGDIQPLPGDYAIYPDYAEERVSETHSPKYTLDYDTSLRDLTTLPIENSKQDQEREKRLRSGNRNHGVTYLEMPRKMQNLRSLDSPQGSKKFKRKNSKLSSDSLNRVHRVLPYPSESIHSFKENILTRTLIQDLMYKILSAHSIGKIKGMLYDGSKNLNEFNQDGRSNSYETSTQALPEKIMNLNHIGPILTRLYPSRDTNNNYVETDDITFNENSLFERLENLVNKASDDNKSLTPKTSYYGTLKFKSK